MAQAIEVDCKRKMTNAATTATPAIHVGLDCSRCARPSVRARCVACLVVTASGPA
jgi:hypothetical protein